MFKLNKPLLEKITFGTEEYVNLSVLKDIVCKMINVNLSDACNETKEIKKYINEWLNERELHEKEIYAISSKVDKKEATFADILGVAFESICRGNNIEFYACINVLEYLLDNKPWYNAHEMYRLKKLYNDIIKKRSESRR